MLSLRLTGKLSDRIRCLLDHKFLSLLDLVRIIGTQSTVELPLTNTDENESSLFVYPLYKTYNGTYNQTTYDDFIAEWGPVSEDIAAAYPLSKFNITASPKANILIAITHVLSMASFICQPRRALLAAKAAGMPTYSYRFGRTPSCPWLYADGENVPPKEFKEAFGAAHTSEISFVFGNMDQMPFGTGTCNSSSFDKSISQTLINAWSSMATSRSPSTQELPWPQFETCSHQGLHITNNTMVVSSIDFSECQFWDEIYIKLGSVGVRPRHKYK